MEICIATIVAGTPRLGIWCDRCLTSAGYEMDAHLLTDDGISVNSLGTYQGCTRCDHEHRRPSSTRSP